MAVLKLKRKPICLENYIFFLKENSICPWLTLIMSLTHQLQCNFLNEFAPWMHIFLSGFIHGRYTFMPSHSLLFLINHNLWSVILRRLKTYKNKAKKLVPNSWAITLIFRINPAIFFLQKQLAKQRYGEIRIVLK